LLVQVGELLVGDQFAAGRGEPVRGTVFLGLQRRVLRTLAEILDPPLEPDRGLLGGFEIGVELVGQIGFRVSSGDPPGERAVVGDIGNLDRVAAPDALNVEIGLEKLDGAPDLRLSRRPGIAAARALGLRQK
jgi:hypothetical protein